ncbi:MAG: hypothetical protein AB7G11_15515 [Phycisphaerales bacterium]
MSSHTNRTEADGRHGHMSASLASIRLSAKLLLLATACAVLIAAAVGAVMLAGLTDYVLRTPAWLRMSLWALGVVMLALYVRRRIVPAGRFAPSLTEIALRVEQSEPGRRAGLPGLLASGLELGADRAPPPPVVAQASDRFAHVSRASLLTPGRSLRAIGLMALVCILAAAAWTATPTLAAIAAKRIVTPWSGAEWPKRTEVADATSNKPHPRGSGFVLRAILKKNHSLFTMNDSGADARVVGRFRVIVDGNPSSTRRVLLTKQTGRAAREPDGDADAVSVLPQSPPSASSTSSLYEYLIEPWGLTPAGEHAAAAPAKVELEYWFETDDDATAPARVLLVEPPAITHASLSLTPPLYYIAGGDPALASAYPVSPRLIDLGGGADERAAPRPILRGSRVELTLALNKPLPGAAGDPVEWARATLGSDIASILQRAQCASSADAASSSLTDRELAVRWIMDQPVNVQVNLLDEHGIGNVETYGYRFDALEDKPPQASVTLPIEDKTVLPTASLDLRAEGRDDIGLTSVALWQQIARPPADSSGVPAEPVSDAAPIATQQASPSVASPGPDYAGAFSVPGSLPPRLDVGARLDLGTLSVVPGDEVWLTARAADAYELQGDTHPTTVSSIRRLRIISQEQFIEQVWAELAGVRRAAIAMAEDQQRLRSETARNAEASRLERSQAAISDRIAREGQALASVESRMQENGLRDPEMQEILRDAKDALDDAGKSSVQAAQNLTQAKQREQQSGSPDADSRDAAQADQKDTQESLEQLAERLDQGQDLWSMKRAVEKLLQDQKDLKAKTADIGRQTTGRRPSDLTAPERESLQQASQEQQGLAQRAAEAIQKMMDAEQNLRKNDPAAADAMNQATRQAQRDQLQQKMEQAAQQVQQNQTNTAQSQQQQAIESMEQMLDQLQNTAKNRDEVLRRQLATLIESLEALIRDQEGQLDALTEALVKGDPKAAGLDRGMVRLHQNTLGVLDEARRAAREIAPVADLIDEAAAAQQQAVIALRAEPIKADQAQQSEVASLDKLKEAKELAEKLDREARNRQTQRQRAELKKAYAEALTQQLALRQETDALVGVEATRRTRAEARTLGERQRAIQDSLAKLESQSKELSDAVMFSFAHKRLDDSMGRAATTLADGVADRVVTRNQDSAVRILQALIEALDQKKDDDDQFRQQQDQQQGNGNQNQNGRVPLVPDSAQVKLLRLMQQETLDLTREADASKDASLTESVGRLQSDLAQQAEALIRKLMESQGGPPPGGPEPDINPGAGDKPADPPPAGASAPLGYPQPQPEPKPAPPKPDPSSPPVSPAPASDPKSPPPAQPDPDPKQPDKPKPDQPKDPGLPSLDDLLGTGDKTRPGDKPPVDPLDPNSADLERLLTGREIGDAFKQAVALMGDASKRLADAKDTSLTTQRVQEGIVRRLDQLLSSLEQMQQQQQQQSSSSQQQQEQQQRNVPQQQQRDQQNQENQGENKGQVIEPPARRDAPIRPGLDAARSAWGKLPDRVRDLLVQGSSDRFSSMYEAMTEAYYKKLAEQGKSR